MDRWIFRILFALTCSGSIAGEAWAAPMTWLTQDRSVSAYVSSVSDQVSAQDFGPFEASVSVVNYPWGAASAAQRSYLLSGSDGIRAVLEATAGGGQQGGGRSSLDIEFETTEDSIFAFYVHLRSPGPAVTDMVRVVLSRGYEYLAYVDSEDWASEPPGDHYRLIMGSLPAGRYRFFADARAFWGGSAFAEVALLQPEPTSLGLLLAAIAARASCGRWAAGRGRGGLFARGSHCGLGRGRE